MIVLVINPNPPGQSYTASPIRASHKPVTTVADLCASILSVIFVTVCPTITSLISPAAAPLVVAPAVPALVAMASTLSIACRGQQNQKRSRGQNKISQRFYHLKSPFARKKILNHLDFDIGDKQQLFPKCGLQ